MRKGWILVLALAASACHSAGMYGHSRVYSPLDEEESATKSATEYDPVMAQRSPGDWKGKNVMLFGVVKARNPGPGGNADLTLSMRTLEPRNLCESESEDSCRVTVSDREHAVVHALVRLTGEDDIGKDSVGAGSLLRVVGKISDSVDANDGSPVLRATYYRHWPRGFFVTTSARDQMRR
jgi:hypothetical protein